MQKKHKIRKISPTKNLEKKLTPEITKKPKLE